MNEKWLLCNRYKYLYNWKNEQKIFGQKKGDNEAIYMSEKRCYNCYWHSYDWFDDGDEFEVCEKGNEIGRICKDYLDFDEGDEDMINEYEKENILNVCKRLKKLGLITDIVKKNYSIEILINIDDNSEEDSRKIRDRIKKNFETQGYKVNIKGSYWLDIIFVDIIQRIDGCFSG